MKLNIRNANFATITVVAALFATLLAVTTARAAIFTIADGDVAGLIAAIDTADGNGEADTINLAPGGTYTLTVVDNTPGVVGGNGLPVITSEITINGNGATIERSSAAGTPDFRIFLVDTLGVLSLNDVTVTGGSALGLGPGGASGNGGGILNFESLELTNSTVSSNAASASGGGISNIAGTVMLTNSTVSANTASGCCGGIQSSGSSTLTLIDSTVSGNTAGTNAGGVANDTGGVLTLTNSTVSGNTAGAGGNGCCGGILNAGIATTLTNSTVSGNTATQNGGGITSTTSVTLNNSTITANTANTGGGISIVAGTVEVKNTIVAENTALLGSSVGPDCFNPFPGPPFNATLDSLDNNLIGTNSGCSFTAATGDQVGTAGSPIDPLLGPLADNGGPTQTHALLLDPVPSPAIDAVPLIDCTDAAGDPLLFDQRGVARPQGPACDIGAFELGGEVTIETLAVTVEDLSLPKGLEGALLSSLDAAGDSLVRENFNSARGQLGAFINKVEAQAGKKILEGDADQLIDLAQQLIDGLS